jgi:adenylylsulfate reductase subunit B
MFVFHTNKTNMPSFVINEKCDGCKALDKTACQYICPNDLMVLDKSTNKAYNRAVDMCWECYSCVKICPNQAIEVRGYADFMPLGAAVQPLRSTDAIMWSIRFRNKQVKRFKFPIRTIPEGTLSASGGFAEGGDDLRSPELRTEPESIGTELYKK